MQYLLRDLNRRFKEQDRDMVNDYGFPEPTEPATTELGIELEKYDKETQSELFNQLCAATPMTAEMQQVFNRIKKALAAKETAFIFIQGQAGSGKSTFLKKIMAYTRSLGKIALGCASTGLAAQLYEDFHTAHSLFGVPVVNDDNDYDHEAELESTIWTKPERLELLRRASLIGWDEFMTNHKQTFDCASRALHGFQNKVVVCISDCRQIPPVVKYGKEADIIRAHILSSQHWDNFEVYFFSINLRLRNLREELQRWLQHEGLQLSEAARNHQYAMLEEDVEKQEQYAKFLIDIGNGNNSAMKIPNPTVRIVHEDEELHQTKLAFLGNTDNFFIADTLPPSQHEATDPDDAPTLPYIEKALNFLHPNGFVDMHHRSILAATNDQVS